MFKNILETIYNEVNSKRFWATLTSIITLAGAAYFPEYTNTALGIVGVLSAWVLSNGMRNTTDRTNTAASSPADGFTLPPELVDLIRSRMVQDTADKINGGSIMIRGSVDDAQEVARALLERDKIALLKQSDERHIAAAALVNGRSIPGPVSSSGM